jgi:hypothetical protein
MLAQFDGLKKIRSLKLSETQVTDAGLAHLEGSTQLRELDLSFNHHVTDKGAGASQKLDKPSTTIVGQCHGYERGR